jgi:predicted ATPase with chaperone activity
VKGGVAIETAGLRFPQGRLTANLTPADLPESSGHYDLAIALAVLAASGEIDGKALRNWLVFGELSLAADLGGQTRLSPLIWQKPFICVEGLTDPMPLESRPKRACKLLGRFC